MNVRATRWFWATIVILGIVVVTMGLSTSALIANHDEVDLELTDIDAWNDLDVAVLELDTARRDYVLTGDVSDRATYADARARILDCAERLDLDGKQVPDAHKLLAVIQQHLQIADQQMQSSLSVSEADIRAIVATLRGLIDKLDDHEHVLKTERVRANHLMVIERLAQLLGLVIVIFAFVSLHRHMEARRKLQRHLQQLNDELEQRVDERTNALRTAEDQLRQAHKLEAIGRLAGGIAHDFNNLLTVILTCSDTLRDELDGEQRELAGDIRDAGKRAAELTRQLLAFSRRQVLAPEVLDPGKCVERMTRMLNRVIGEHIELRVIPSSTASVEVDPGQLEQVIMNLAVNARDAMPNGGSLTIETSDIELAERERSGRYVLLAVRDTGIGMDSETQERVFEPFFTTKPVGKGTGLGLPTVLGIVEQSNGHVRIDSKVGAGTTFQIYLPVATARPERPRVTRPPGMDKHGGRASDRHRNATILVVEDDAAVRKRIISMLAGAGYNVLAAQDGIDGLDVWNTHRKQVDLVLTDVVMPRMGGRAFVETLRKTHTGFGVLYMTGYTDDTALLGGGAGNPDACIQKPLVPDVLLRRVRAALDERAAAN
jgi:signal transduction histidine kinase